MKARPRGKPPRWRLVVAILAGLCLLTALVGGWTLRTHLAVSASQQTVVELAGGADGDADAGVDTTRGRFENTIQPTAHLVFGTQSGDRKPFKSAGLKRDRPPSWSRSAPTQWSLVTPASMTTPRRPAVLPQCPAPATSEGGQDLLNQLCVARR